jgi:hypothetical protein
VRGLDYYMRTTFEITHAIMAWRKAWARKCPPPASAFLSEKTGW